MCKKLSQLWQGNQSQLWQGYDKVTKYDKVTNTKILANFIQYGFNIITYYGWVGGIPESKNGLRLEIYEVVQSNHRPMKKIYPNIVGFRGRWGQQRLIILLLFFLECWTNWDVDKGHK